MKDHLGSTRMTLNESGTSVESDLYTAYGEEVTLEDGGSEETTEKFTGKEMDRDGAVSGLTAGMGLNYFGWRYYDPVVGYWISRDPKEQFWSGYSYTGNGFNPINGVDGDGLDFGTEVLYFHLDIAEFYLSLWAGVGSGASLGQVDKLNDDISPGWRDEGYANMWVRDVGRAIGVSADIYLLSYALAGGGGTKIFWSGAQGLQRATIFHSTRASTYTIMSGTAGGSLAMAYDKLVQGVFYPLTRLPHTRLANAATNIQWNVFTRPVWNLTSANYALHCNQAVAFTNAGGVSNPNAILLTTELPILHMNNAPVLINPIIH